MNYDQNDLDLMILCLWREARGQGTVGMRAVGHVIYNRVGWPGFATTLHDVIMGRNQFTSMSVPSDPQFHSKPADNDIYALSASIVCPKILDGTDVDPTEGAHYYANLKYTTSGWFFDHIVNDTVNHPHLVTIGQHDFYL